MNPAAETGPAPQVAIPDPSLTIAFLQSKLTEAQNTVADLTRRLKSEAERDAEEKLCLLEEIKALRQSDTPGALLLIQRANIRGLQEEVSKLSADSELLNALEAQTVRSVGPDGRLIFPAIYWPYAQRPLNLREAFGCAHPTAPAQEGDENDLPPISEENNAVYLKLMANNEELAALRLQLQSATEAQANAELQYLLTTEALQEVFVFKAWPMQCARFACEAFENVKAERDRALAEVAEAKRVANEALSRAVEIFDTYEAMHAAKETEEGNHKARVNDMHARRLAALSSGGVKEGERVSLNERTLSALRSCSNSFKDACLNVATSRAAIFRS